MQGDLSPVTDTSVKGAPATVDGAIADRAPEDNAHSNDTPVDAASVDGSPADGAYAPVNNVNKHIVLYRNCHVFVSKKMLQYQIACYSLSSLMS